MSTFDVIFSPFKLMHEREQAEKKKKRIGRVALRMRSRERLRLNVRFHFLIIPHDCNQGVERSEIFGARAIQGCWL